MNLLYKILYVYYQYGLLLYGRCLSLFLKPNSKENSVLYLAAFFPENAGYQWRVQKWGNVLREKGYKVDIAVANSKELLQTYNANTYRFLISFMRTRFRQVLIARKYETVIVRRELLLFNEYGNHFLEKLLRKMCTNVILDIDDDLSAAKRQPHAVTSLFGKILLEDGNSFRNSFQYYDRFFVASNYLKAYVQKHGGVEESRIEVIPTCVDYDKYERKTYSKDNVLRLGWIGSANNFQYLQHIEGHLNKLYRKIPFEFIVISKDCAFEKAEFPVVYKNWSLESEVKDLQSIDIGLMPLNECKESMGKGGFKLIQYMGLGIVGVASAITINTEIVEDGVNSFLIHNDEEWIEVLQKLLSKEIDLEAIGRLARRKVDNNYTFEANKNCYLAQINKKHI